MKQALTIKVKGTKIGFSKTFNNDREVEGAIMGFILGYFDMNRTLPEFATPFADIHITINPIEEEK